MRSDNELITQVGSQHISQPLQATSPESENYYGTTQKAWEEAEVGVFQLATPTRNSFQSKPSELTFRWLTPLIGLRPLSSAII